jgi:hypothetical protein
MIQDKQAVRVSKRSPLITCPKNVDKLRLRIDVYKHYLSDWPALIDSLQQDLDRFERERRGRRGA